MNWLSAITAVSKLFGALTGLYRDWGLRRAGAKEVRLAALEAGQARAKRMAEITAHRVTLDDDDIDRRLRQYQCASGRMRMGETNQRGRARSGPHRYAIGDRGAGPAR